MVFSSFIELDFVGARPYSLSEIVAATQNFEKEIGRGGFGPVYYGKLHDGQEVAVKVLDVASRQGSMEFFNEVDFQFKWYEWPKKPTHLHTSLKKKNNTKKSNAVIVLS